MLFDWEKIPREVYSTDKAPQAIGAYSQAVRAGDTIYLSGQIPLDPATGKLVEGCFAEQVEQVFCNLSAVLKAAGVDFSHVVKVNAYLTDLAHFATLNEIMARRWGEFPYPARAAVQVCALPKGALVEIEAIATLKK